MAPTHTQANGSYLRLSCTHGETQTRCKPRDCLRALNLNSRYAREPPRHISRTQRKQSRPTLKDLGRTVKRSHAAGMHAAI